MPLKVGSYVHLLSSGRFAPVRIGKPPGGAPKRTGTGSGRRDSGGSPRTSRSRSRARRQCSWSSRKRMLFARKKSGMPPTRTGKGAAKDVSGATRGVDKPRRVVVRTSKVVLHVQAVLPALIVRLAHRRRVVRQENVTVVCERDKGPSGRYTVLVSMYALGVLPRAVQRNAVPQ